MNRSAPDSVKPARAAFGVASGHFGEIVQGLDAAGRVALVTLPCGAFRARAQYRPGGPLLVYPAARAEAHAAARAVLRAIGAPVGGALRLSSDAPRGVGVGSSTMDALAAIRAVCAAYGRVLTPMQEARLCVAAEGASDPRARLRAPLFAWRQGVALERLPPLPPLWAAGGFDGAGYPTPLCARFAPIEDAAALLRRGLARGDAGMIGEAATLSATANQDYAPKPHWAEITQAARDCGALGVAVAHTGSAAALLFDNEPAAHWARPVLSEIGLRSPVVFRAG